jgi:RNA ligase
LTNIIDLFEPGLLGEMLAGGYVRVQHHPDRPLQILNYTEKATYERVWNEVTLTCRGLIVDTAGEVVARPFRKFFNYGEPTAPQLDLDEEVLVTDKADGSLGVLYPLGDGRLAVATRGSFTSEQALHATKVWQERYAHTARLPEGMTVLCEIVYPENRIVLDYGDVDELVLLGCVDIATGRSHGHEHVDYWPGPRAVTFGYSRLSQALAAEPRENAEGLVVHFVHSDERLKIKQADYLQLHRIITRCTARVLWEHLAVNACAQHATTGSEFLVRRLMMSPDRVERIQAVGPDWLDTFLAGVPDEFYQWVRARVAELQEQAEALLADILAIYGKYAAEAGEDRKAFAMLAKDHEHSGALFSLNVGREIDTYVWRLVYPAHEIPFMNRGEDVA